MRKFIIRPFQMMLLCALVCAFPVELQGQLVSSILDRTGFALLVDVSDYRDANIPPLRAKSNEGDKIKNALLSVGGFPEGQIQFLAGEKATREGITEALTAMVERAKTQANAHVLFYLKCRALKTPDQNYFLPYNARVGATSTYIDSTELMNWFALVPLRTKALITAAWDVKAQDDIAFSTKLGDILRDKEVDADGNRSVTLAEIETKIRDLGFHGNYPVRIVGDGATVLMLLPSLLEVNSQPPAAAVFLDGVEKGVTPAQILNLAPGTHRIHVQKELHLRSEERTVEIAQERGQRVVLPPYQLKPIRVYGTAFDTEKKVVAGVEVRIIGTGYQHTVDNGGKFSFENWQAYGLLELGKTYAVVAQSSDGLYSGSTSCTFSGTADIRLEIPLTPIHWINMAAQQLRAGDRAGAMAIFDAKLQSPKGKEDSLIKPGALNDVTPELALAFLTHLESKLQTEPNNLQWRVVAARLTELTGNVAAAKRHWQEIKTKASEESSEYKQAVARLKELEPNRRGWILLLVAGGVVVLGAVGFYFIIRRRLREFQEIPNPYIAGKPISEREMFFGREDVFNFIKDKFSRSAKDITIVLHGGRRTGKTSILYQIANGRLGADFVPVFIDMQEMAGVDAHDFFRLIAQKVSEAHKKAVALSEADSTRLDELYRRLEDKSGSAYQSFNNFLTHVASTLEGKYIIFLIDEYEILERKVNDGDLTAEIFTYLRHLMQNMANLAFIFAGSSDFAKRQRQEWALMFNMAQPKEVSFLSRDDAVALITEPVKDLVRYDQKAVDRVWRLTAGQPFFTQVICLQIIEALNLKQKKRVTLEEVAESCHDIVENAPYHFAYIWGELTAEEKIMVSLLAEVLTAEMAYASVDDIASRLSHYDLRYSRADISKTLARLLEKHLIEKKLDTQAEAYRFRMDLTRAWIQAEHPTWGVIKEVQNHE